MKHSTLSSSPNSGNTFVSGIPKRTIKFRFWLGHTKKMTYEHTLIEISNAHWDFTEDIIPLQFTGLNDKKGNEIYEGDICKRPSSNGTKEQMCYGKIEFYKGSFCFKREHSNLRIAVDNICYHYSDCEIIGNVFENPELLG